MARRKTYRMASPKRGTKKKTSEESASDRVVRRLSIILGGPTGQQLLSLAVTSLGVLTLFTVAGLNSGALINGWARLLVLLFGWGAYPTGVLITALGLLWLRHLVHKRTVWRWRPLLGLELALFGLLGLTHTLLRHQGWLLVQSGQGGGLIGWALSVFLTNYLGPLSAGVLLIFMTLVGTGLAFDITGQEIQNAGKRLASLWRAYRARQATKAPKPQVEPAVAMLGNGIASSPLSDTGSKPESPRVFTEPSQSKQEAPKKPQTKPSTRTRQTTPRPKSEEAEAVALPPIKLLQTDRGSSMNDRETRRKSRIIEETLAQFGIPAEVSEVRLGPTVTQFGITPGYLSRDQEGKRDRKVRVSQITSLTDDLALALAARSLRIEAPVPGRAIVGIEVPNDTIDLVRLRRVLESKAFEKCDAPLCFAVGLDVAGSVVTADLAKMPHLLIAGTTGSGKSVFVKSLAVSLIMNNTPQQLRLIAIDPKMVELSHLNGLPHLLGPAETDLDHILRVLRWTAVEMDNRYKEFAKVGARNLDHYNQKAKRKGEEIKPRIVVLIDELADLMMASPEDTERTLTRIAQMARATGIHLVVATQRPSTDVVTGLIKANFPARISFGTASGVDSRVILDTPGAETLLGRGDMLFLPPDAAAPRRIQGCFVSEKEIKDIIRYWQRQVGATPAKPPWQVAAEQEGPQKLRIKGESEDAELLEQAIALARDQGKITTSGIQRRLRISYPRAARLMEEMESMGIVGPQRAAGRKRRVLLGDNDELKDLG
jgi:DNA segregation ATPase FtsK/SpoIIIE, S-DNA-T family